MSVTQPEFDRLKNKVSKLETNASIAYTLTVGDTITAGQLSSSERDSSQQNFYGYSRFIDNKNDNYSGISLVNYKDSSLTNNFSYIDFRNNLNTPDSAIYAGHNTDGSSYIRIVTTPAGSRGSDRRKDVFDIYDSYVYVSGALTLNNSIQNNSLIFANGSSTDQWLLLGTFAGSNVGETCDIEIKGGVGFNGGTPTQYSRSHIQIRNGNGTGGAANVNANLENYGPAKLVKGVVVKATNNLVLDTSWDVYLNIDQYCGNSLYTVNVSPSATWTNIRTAGVAAPTAATYTVSASNSIQFNSPATASSGINTTTISSTGNITTAGNLNVDGNTTLGNAAGDSITFNASTVTLNNNLNIDSNTLYIDATNNRIGIGTSSPSYPLHVVGSVSVSATYGYLNNAGAVGTATANTPLSIRSDNRIAATEFNAISDKRNKFVYNLVEQDLLNRFKQINIADFKHKEHSNFEFDRGVIAQEVETLFPDAVKKTADYVADIFGPPSEKINISDNEYKITMAEVHSALVGDKIKIAFKTDNIDEDICEVISVQDQYTFTIKSNKIISDNCSIMGRLVDDYRLVNYQYLFSTTMKVVQNLLQRIEILENKLSGSI